MELVRDLLLRPAITDPSHEGQLTRILHTVPIPVTPIQLTLRALREKAGLTQVELAERVGVRQATISDLETGKSTRIEFDLLDKLCEALGCDPGKLLERDSKRRGRTR